MYKSSRRERTTLFILCSPLFIVAHPSFISIFIFIFAQTDDGRMKTEGSFCLSTLTQWQSRRDGKRSQSTHSRPRARLLLLISYLQHGVLLSLVVTNRLPSDIAHRAFTTKHIPSEEQYEMGNQLSKESRLTWFTREDEKRLFGDDDIQKVDPDFINEFRMLYSSNDEAIPLDFRMCVFMLSVDEIEDRGLYFGCPGQKEGDVWIEQPKGLKLPVGVVPRYYNQFNQRSLNDDFCCKLQKYIVFQQWNHLRQACPDFKCGVCAKTPVPNLAALGHCFYNESEYKINQLASIPVCTNPKCLLIARKCKRKVFDTRASATGFTKGSSAIACANCERWKHEMESDHLECSRCKAVTYCNVKCQKAHWSKHKKACKLVTCQHCERSETSTKFPTCSQCEQVFYCGEDCQKADWSSHRNICNT
jgi:hypothetical protein